MSSPADHTELLSRLAADSRCAAAWRALGARMFPGELSVATGDSVYRFESGVFRGRAVIGARSFDSPRAMRAMRLIGFLHDEGGLVSLSTRWREGARAVLWKPDAIGAESFFVSPPTTEMTLDEPEPKPVSPEPTPTPWAARPPAHSAVKVRRIARPPSIRRPLPPSMTRIHSAIPAQTH